MKQTRNSKLLAEFTAYCEANPEFRFWQALCNWCGADRIAWCKSQSVEKEQQTDTFYWENKNN